MQNTAVYAPITFEEIVIVMIKIELCIRFIVFRLFQIAQVEQITGSVLSLACHEYFSCKDRD